MLGYDEKVNNKKYLKESVVMMGTDPFEMDTWRECVMIVGRNYSAGPWLHLEKRLGTGYVA